MLIVSIVVVGVVIMIARGLFGQETHEVPTGMYTGTVSTTGKPEASGETTATEETTKTGEKTTKSDETTAPDKTEESETTAPEETDEPDSTTEFTASTMYVVGYVYLRSQPDWDSSYAILTLADGAAVQTVSFADGWYLVSFEGQEGYVYQDFLTTQAPE